MKKIFKNLFLPLLLALALPEAASAYDFTVRVDNASSAKLVHATRESSLGTLGNNIPISNGLQNVSASNKWIGVRGSSYDNAPAAVKVNGESISRQGSGSRLSPYYYGIDISKYSSPVLVEIYVSSSTPEYTYDLFMDITDPDGNVAGLTSNKGKNVTGSLESSYSFVYGEEFVVTSNKEEAPDGYALTGKTTTVTKAGNGSFTYTFTPFPHPDSDKPKFSLNIPAADFVPTYIFNSQFNDDDYANYIVSYVINHPDGTTDAIEITDDVIRTPWQEGDTFTLTANVEAYIFAVDFADVTPTQVTVDGNTYYAYTFTPSDEGRMQATFIDPTSGGEQGDNSEPFVVYLTADRSGAVLATSYTKTNQVSGTYPLEANVRTEVECTADGYIKVTITDDGLYSFQTFENTSEKVSFLDYDPPTTYPVTIRKVRSTGDNSQIDNAGDEFTITTNDKSNLQWYELTLNIIDDASNVKVEIGTSYQAGSQTNREITNLKPGTQTIRYSEDDTWVVISSKQIKAIYGVDFDKGAVNKSEDLIPVYSIALNHDATANGTIVVTPERPETQGSKSFTLNVTNADAITSIKRYENQDDWLGSEVKSLTLQEGDNTITFDENEYFRIYASRAATTAKIGDEDIEYSFSTFYEFTPSAGSVVTLQFPAPVVVVRPTFTVLTDMPEEIQEIINWDTDETWPITESTTVIPFDEEGNEMRFNVRSIDPIKATLDGEPVSINGFGFYTFEAAEGKTLEVFFKSAVVVPTTKDFTITVDDKDAIVVYTGAEATTETIVVLSSDDATSNVYAISLPAETEEIHIAPVGQNLINSVTDGENNSYSANADDIFTVAISNGMAINVATEAVAFDETIIVCIDITPGEDNAGLERSGAISMQRSHRTVALVPGRNTVKFNSRYDGAFTYSFAAIPAELHTYLVSFDEDTDELVQSELTANGNSYAIQGADGNIIRTFYKYAAEESTPVDIVPDKHEVTFDIDEDINDHVLILREAIQTVKHPDNSRSYTEYHGTEYNIFVRQGHFIRLHLEFRDAEPVMAYGPARVAFYSDDDDFETNEDAAAKAEHDAYISSITPEGFDHVYSFTVDSPVEIQVAPSDEEENSTTGVENVDAISSEAAHIYNLEGIVVKANGTAADLRQLPAGLYIWNGHKFSVR